MSSLPLRSILGSPIDTATEETFFLFSQGIPNNNLGFLDSTADNLEIEIAGHDYIVRQSPGLLNSNRDEGTTGAVLWKITPLLANWLASIPDILSDVLHNDAVVVELGCGVAGLIGLVLARMVDCYILTDQDYVMKRLRENISANAVPTQGSSQESKKKGKQKQSSRNDALKTLPLDWEKDSAENVKIVMPNGSSKVNLVIVCDCVYNEYLVSHLVSTCVDICKGSSPATVVLIAQQLRSDAVFEVFLELLMEEFDVWRVPDEKISAELRPGSGYIVHLAMLKESSGNAG